MNIIDWILLLVIAFAVVLCIREILRKGMSTCGSCSGKCANCHRNIEKK